MPGQQSEKPGCQGWKTDIYKSAAEEKKFEKKFPFAMQRIAKNTVFYGRNPDKGVLNNNITGRRFYAALVFTSVSGFARIAPKEGKPFLS